MTGDANTSTTAPVHICFPNFLSDFMRILPCVNRRQSILLPHGDSSDPSPPFPRRWGTHHPKTTDRSSPSVVHLESAAIPKGCNRLHHTTLPDTGTFPCHHASRQDA